MHRPYLQAESNWVESNVEVLREVRCKQLNFRMADHPPRIVYRGDFAFVIKRRCPANIKDRISYLAESKCAALEHAYAAAGAAAVKHPAAHKLRSCGTAIVGAAPVPDAPASLERGRTSESRDQYPGVPSGR